MSKKNEITVLTYIDTDGYHINQDIITNKFILYHNKEKIKVSDLPYFDDIVYAKSIIPKHRGRPKKVINNE